MKGKLLLVIVLLSVFALPAVAQSAARTFTNPLVTTRDSADPWMVYHGGHYYFTATLDPDGGIWVWKTRTLAGLDDGLKVKVHTPDANERSRQIWAPELHFINHRWYIYYTASDGVDENHRLYVLESRGRDPLGPYMFKARIYDPTHDGWAIDPSVFRAPGGGLYLLWVAHVPGNGNGIRIAPLRNPWTVAGRSVLIAQADYDWERVRYPINEGPVVLRRAGRLFLVYSASDTGTPDYALGMLTHLGGDVMEPTSWKKSPAPSSADTRARRAMSTAPGITVSSSRRTAGKIGSSITARRRASTPTAGGRRARRDSCGEPTARRTSAGPFRAASHYVRLRVSVSPALGAVRRAPPSAVKRMSRCKPKRIERAGLAGRLFDDDAASVRPGDSFSVAGEASKLWSISTR